MMNAGPRQLRLSDFIRENQESIVKEWISFAGTRAPASEKMSKRALQDHILDILRFIADDMDSTQAPSERFAKSRGEGPEHSTFRDSAAEIHAALRLADGFDIDQMVSEYRALRASVVKQWVAQHKNMTSTDIEELTRFNETIDQAVTESVAHYTKTINNSRNLFLGILGHDLRNPIGAVLMAAQRMARSGSTDAHQAKVVSEIVKSTGRATKILNDLLDLTRSSFGTEMPITKSKVDMAALCHEIADELQAIDKDNRIEVTLEGNAVGSWDSIRMGQVLSNLIGNAIQYSDPSSPVTVAILGDEPEKVTVMVHNRGEAIPAEKLKLVFQSWTRGQDVNDSPDRVSHLGLGLYIARLIVEAHKGEIDVTSDASSGTTFSLHIPRV